MLTWVFEYFGAEFLSFFAAYEKRFRFPLVIADFQKVLSLVIAFFTRFLINLPNWSPELGVWSTTIGVLDLI